MFKQPHHFFAAIYSNKTALYQLAKRDFQQQYQGSYLGFIWAFLQPLVYIAVLYMIFTLGFKTGGEGEMPFALYLVTGMIAWTYFSENLSVMTGAIKQHGFLVKKADFRLSILPIVKILSSLVPHLSLIVVAIAMCWYQGYSPGIYTVQVLYYLVAMEALLLGLGWLTSSTSIFIKDISKLVALVIQFGFWLTPLFWNIEMVPERYQWIFKLNPICYIVTGYRDSLVMQVPFWDRPQETAYFWLVTVCFLALGLAVFRKLRPHFAEVI